MELIEPTLNISPQSIQSTAEFFNTLDKTLRYFVYSVVKYLYLSTLNHQHFQL